MTAARRAGQALAALLAGFTVLIVVLLLGELAARQPRTTLLAVVCAAGGWLLGIATVARRAALEQHALHEVYGAVVAARDERIADLEDQLAALWRDAYAADRLADLRRARTDTDDLAKET